MAERIIYGKSETKRAISNVLMKVISEYKFTSFSALNAVLKLYNVTANRGEKDSRIYKNKGFTYRILDADRNKTGIPIKSSSIYMKPQWHFGKINLLKENLRKPYLKRIETDIDWALNKKTNSLNGIKTRLKKKV